VAEIFAFEGSRLAGIAVGLSHFASVVGIFVGRVRHYDCSLGMMLGLE
jgi:hypothetical protein